MIDYIVKVKGATDNLSAIGEPVLEQNQVMNLLRSLGSDYNAVVTAINIRDNKISIEAVHSMLLAFLSNKAQSITSPLCLPVMPPPLITEVVEENTMAAEDKAIFQIPATTPTKVVVVVMGVDMDIMENTIQPTLRSHNVNYVASLVILFMSVTIGLISSIKTHKTMVLPL
jgi:hypothetical protein